MRPPWDPRGLGFYTPLREESIMKARTVLFLATALLFFLIFSPAQAATLDGGPTLTSDELLKLEADFESLPLRESVSPADLAARQASYPKSYSLLSYLTYDPAARNQGGCGNCWLWASSGVAEVALAVQEGIRDRLSIQYPNSCMSFCPCGGGNINQFVDYFRFTAFLVPWANKNAFWQNGDGLCDGPSCDSIGAWPFIPVEDISGSRISIFNVTQEEAIANVKDVLLQKKAIYFGFHLPVSKMNEFRTFWGNSDEATPTGIMNLNKHVSKDIVAAGHAVLCVGWDETDPDNPAWIMVNSWGANGGRPNGIFRMRMDTSMKSTFQLATDTPGTWHQVLGFATMDINFDKVEGGGNYDYYLPYFSDGQDRWSGVALRNMSGSSQASVEVQTFKSGGTMTQRISKTLRADGQEAFLVNTSQGVFSYGWVKVRSNQPLKGLSFYTDDGVYMADMELIPGEVLSKTHVVPHLALDDEWDMILCVCNPNLAAVEVNATRINPYGIAKDSKMFTIPSMGAGRYSLINFIAGKGSLKISSSEKITGFTLFRNLKTGGTYMAGLLAQPIGLSIPPFLPAKLDVTVTGAGGMILIGATVTVGSNTGVTDVHGRALVSNIPAGNHFVYVSYQGKTSRGSLPKETFEAGKTKVRTYSMPW
ncbi:MAG: hypothetical protein EOM25_13430 [Deltaproteobacteria bacterium]|nr:hypothetical protein [Deltaproteobacteria bacterium]